MKNPQILITDLGSQYTLVIGRTLRELGYRSIILPPDKTAKWLSVNKPKGIIASGGPRSVYEEGAPDIPIEAIKSKKPILAICYGMQWLAKYYGGEVKSHHDRKEYGKALTHFEREDPIFNGLKNTESVVWASHGDSVTSLPAGFKVIATPGGDISTAVLAGMDLGISAMSNPDRKVWCLQFHPEVTHTQEGKVMLRNFAENICGCKRDWYTDDAIKRIQAEVKKEVADERAIIGFSGGVDSTTLSKILALILGDNLLAVTIDSGSLRENELEDIRFAAKVAGVQLKIVRAAARFQKSIGRTIDAEEKRKRFIKIYSRIFDEEAKKFGAAYIIQGTLATDLIESGKAGDADTIKSHHNALAEFEAFDLHPFRNLFKYEVRDLSRQSGLPDEIANKQPFPGPGLNLRVVGMPSTPKNRAIVRWADARVTEILKKYKLMNRISQLIVALLGTKMVGIKGDRRTYKYPIAVRAVVSNDFMTCDGFRIPVKVKKEIESVVTKHPEIVHVGFFKTSKPPATTEFE